MSYTIYVYAKRLTTIQRGAASMMALGGFRRLFYTSALALLAILWIVTMKFIITLFSENTIVIINPGRMSLVDQNFIPDEMAVAKPAFKPEGSKPPNPLLDSLSPSDSTTVLPRWIVKLRQTARKALVAGRPLTLTNNYSTSVNNINSNSNNARRRGKVKLAIGIASVYREENYLNQTLTSLVRESDMDLKERKNTVIIIYLADYAEEKNKRQLEFIQTHFSKHLDSGFFQIIQSSPEIYPSFDFALSKRTFRDPIERVLWRAKQVIDFIYLFTYALELSDYYLVMEDDIVAANYYLSAISKFISDKDGKRWIALELTGFLGIGLLFHTPDLLQLIDFLCMFYQNQPVDMLMREYISLNVPDPELTVRHVPSLFQHIGTRSSLDDKVQKIKDISFITAGFTHVNPAADIVTTLRTYRNYLPEYGYYKKPNSFFWGIPTGNKKDTFDIIFKAPLVRLKRLIIVTGNKAAAKNPKDGSTKLRDTIVNGTIEIGNVFRHLIGNNVALCDNLESIVTFSEKIDLRVVRRNITNVQCIRIGMQSKQKSWVVIKEINVFS